MFRILIAVGFLLACVPSVQGAKDIEFNVGFFCGWDGYYRPMEWTPVEISIGSDLKEPFSGIAHDDRPPGRDQHAERCPPLRPDARAAVGRTLSDEIRLRHGPVHLAIRDEKGRTRWHQTINLWDYSPQQRMLRVVQEQDLLIGLIGQAQFGLLRLPQETACVSDRNQGKVYLGSKTPRDVPWDWTGYASLDVLVICDMEWSLLQPQQIKAIREWISNGGTALLVLGQHPWPAESPLAEILPFRIEGPTQVQVPAQALSEWGLDSSRTQMVTAWTLRPKPDAVIDKATKELETAGLYGVGYAGFGRVAVLGFTPSQLGEVQAGHSTAFWTRQIAACCRPQASAVSGLPTAGGRRIVPLEESPQTTGGPRSGFNPSDNYYRLSVSQNASNQVMEYLYKLEQMKPLSIWWIVLTLMALALLLGPVDYLVLKKLDKLPYTWLTSAGWIAIFTVGAYFGVQWFRSGAWRSGPSRSSTVWRTAPARWATCYTSVFAPRSGDYRLSGLVPNQWWSGISPMRQELWSYQRDAALQQVHCLQVDGGNLPVSLPVNMWTVQPLISEWSLDKMPFAATVDHRQAQRPSRSPTHRIAPSSGDTCCSRTRARTWDRCRPVRPSGSMCGPARSGPGNPAARCRRLPIAAGLCRLRRRWTFRGIRISSAVPQRVPSWPRAA